MSKSVACIQSAIDVSADCPYKGFRESKKEWDKFGGYVKDMVAETALRWDAIKHSGPEGSLEGWKKNIDELGGYTSLFHSLR